MSCIDSAAAQRLPTRIIGITAAVAAFLRSDGPWVQAITLHASAARTAQDLGAQASQAGALLSLGDVLQITGDYPGATSVLEQALGIFHSLGDQLGEANALFCLGEVQRQEAISRRRPAC